MHHIKQKHQKSFHAEVFYFTNRLPTYCCYRKRKQTHTPSLDIYDGEQDDYRDTSNKSQAKWAWLAPGHASVRLRTLNPKPHARTSSRLCTRRSPLTPSSLSARATLRSRDEQLRTSTPPGPPTATPPSASIQRPRPSALARHVPSPLAPGLPSVVQHKTLAT
jgi:hypothetical protein